MFHNVYETDEMIMISGLVYAKHFHFHVFHFLCRGTTEGIILLESLGKLSHFQSKKEGSDAGFCLHGIELAPSS